MTTEQIDPLCETLTEEDVQVLREGWGDTCFAHARLPRILATYHALARVTAERDALHATKLALHETRVRLEAERDAFRDKAEGWSTVALKAESEADALRVENARLRLALEQIAVHEEASDLGTAFSGYTARTALTLTGGRDNAS